MNELNYFPGGVIRWAGEETSEPLAVQLRQRPGVWALIGQNVTGVGLGSLRAPWRSLEGMDDIEVEVRPVDDGEYGVLHEVYARYLATDPANAGQE